MADEQWDAFSKGSFLDSTSEMSGATGALSSAAKGKKVKKNKDKKKKKSKKSSKEKGEPAAYGSSLAGSLDESYGEIRSNRLFEKAMAKALKEDQAALTEAFKGMQEDKAFLSAFGEDDVNFESVAFEPDFGQSLANIPANRPAAVSEQAPAAAARTFKTTGLDDEESDVFVVDKQTSGENMKNYARRRGNAGSVHGADSRDSNSAMEKSATTNNTTRAANKSHVDGMEKVQPPSALNGRNMGGPDNTDWSNFHVEAKARSGQGGDDMNDSATINSEITGLTGVFTTRNGAFEVEDDDSSSDDEDEEVLAYPKYDPAYSKFMMMQQQGKKSSKDRRLKVNFGSVCIRNYERIMGDNPSVMSGAPLGIGWKYAGVITYPSPDSHDKARGRPPYPSKLILLNRDQRHKLLQSLGYSDKDIASAVRVIIKEKNKRKTTVNNLGASKMEETMEGMGKGLKRMLFMKG